MILRIVFIVIGLMCFLPGFGWSQVFETDRFEFGISPDLWYNSVDGFQVGVMGGIREPGRIQEGPHFLDYGMLVGTRYPDITFHYRLNYRHTIISHVDLERLSANLRSYRRDGFQNHGAGLRWSTRSENEKQVWSVSSQYYAHEIYNDRYQIYDHLWSEGWTDIVRINADLTYWGDWHRNSSFFVDARLSPGAFDTNEFARVEAAAQHRFRFSESLGLNTRVYAGWVSDKPPSPYYLNFAGASIIDLQDSRFTRARGSVPPSWIKNGFFHKSGGANLRGFQQKEAGLREQPALDTQSTPSNEPLAPVTESMAAFNTELEIPNPLNRWMQSFSVVGEFIKFSSYLFNDTGIISLRENHSPADTNDSTFWLVNTGVGFELSFNAPDYLGRERGFQVRFDIPFWFFDSNNDRSTFELRPILGLGSIYNF